MRSVFFIILGSLIIQGCSSIKQQGSLFIALDAFDDGDYQKCFSKASKAETFGNYSRSLNAQIMFYKALCLERMENVSASHKTFEDLIDLYPDTDWGVAAKHKLHYQKLKCK